MRGLGPNADGNTLADVTLIFGVLLGVIGIALGSTKLSVEERDVEAAEAVQPSTAIAPYQLSLYEIDTAPGDMAETWAPQSNGGGEGTLNDNPDRHGLQFAVMNRRQRSVSGASTDVPILAFIKVFMSEAVGDTERAGKFDFNEYLEVTGEIEAGDDDDVLKETIQI